MGCDHAPGRPGMRRWATQWRVGAGQLGRRTGRAEALAAARRRRNQAGVIGLTDAMLGIGVVAVAMPAIIALTNQQTRETQDQVVARQLKAVGEAVPAYVKDHFATIYNGIGGPGGDFITVAALINTGYLPVNFNEQNAFKQKHVVLLRRVAQDGGACAALPATPPACKQLIEAVVVTTGGTALDANHASHIAVLAGAHGGLIADGSTARGSYATWCVDLNLFRSAPGAPTSCPATDSRPSNSNALSNANFTYSQPAAGGLALAMFFNGGEMMSEYIDRFNTGNPEDNTMHTDLNMGDDTIANVRTLQIAGVTQGLDAPRMTMINDLEGGNYTANSGNLSAANYAASGNVTAGGNVTLSGNLTASGNVTAGSMYTANYLYTASDARLKSNIRPIENSLRLVERLQGHRFDWTASGRSDIGFIAQEIRQVVPEAVGTAPNGTFAVKYDIVVPVLVEAVKTLAGRLARMEEGPRQDAPAAAPP